MLGKEHKEHKCPLCGHHDIYIDEKFPTLRYNKRRICMNCVIRKPDAWISKYVTDELVYTVFDKKSYAIIRGEI